MCGGKPKPKAPWEQIKENNSFLFLSPLPPPEAQSLGSTHVMCFNPALCIHNTKPMITGLRFSPDYHRVAYNVHMSERIQKSLCLNNERHSPHELYMFCKASLVWMDKTRNLCISVTSDTTRFRWVCLFIRTDLEKCSITSLAHQWVLCSEWVPSEWESKQLIKTSQ